MKHNRNWHGTDTSNAESLFVYNLLIRWVPKEKSWQCIYRNPNDPNRFSFTWITETDIENHYNDLSPEKKKTFMEECEHTWESWRKRPIVSQIYDLVNHVGAENIFSTDYSGGDTIKQVCKRLHIKYEENFKIK